MFSKMSQEKRHLGIYENLQSMFQPICVGVQFTIVNKIVKGGLHTFHFFPEDKLVMWDKSYLVKPSTLSSKTGKEKNLPLKR